MKHLFLLLFTFGLFTVGFAADYYVSPSGNDGNTGNVGGPWQTLQYAVDQLQPGDVLHVGAGSYNEKITLNVSGTAGNPIRITGGFPLPVIDGSGLTSQNALIAIFNQSYITINQLELQDNVMNDAQGILVEGNCQGITLSNNYIHDIHFSANASDTANASTNAQAIIVFGTDPAQAISDLLIERNSVFNCRLGYSEGIAVNGNVDGFQVRDNDVYSLTNIGIVAIGHEGTCSDSLLDQARNGSITDNRVRYCNSPYAACGGIYVDGAKAITIERNSCYNNDYGIEVGCEHPGKTASEIMVRNNILRFNAYTGIAFGGYDYPSLSGSVENSTVYNNTLFQNDTLQDGNGELALSYAPNCLFENNIFFTNDQNRAVTVSTTIIGLHFNYNLYYNEALDSSNLIETTDGQFTLAEFQLAGLETNGVFGDPVFSVMQTGDWYFSLDFTNWSNPSVAIDNGNPSLSELELGDQGFFGGPRIWGIRADIGAAEFWLEGLAETNLKTLIVDPNPTTGIVHLDAHDEYDAYTIIGLDGKQLAAGKLINQEVNLSAFPNGVYVVRFSGTAGLAQSRIVKVSF
ncbi:MAG: T9SS type A sorting domain-containing protein [Fluviicola sp.]|nr:T9SS type A sorting domain-containing protein [Fluviicola sp.]